MTDKNPHQNNLKGMDLDAIRARLGDKKGREYWRSLSELAESEEFLEFLHEEFPRQSALASSMNRRDFLKLMAASLGLAGLTACVPHPIGQIMPYVESPEGIVPGEPLFFATAMELDGYARGLLLKSREGRPIKVEGNPDHPASLGASDSFAQAALLNLYDPERAQVVTRTGRIAPVETFRATLVEAMADQRAQGGAGLRILTETVTSPTLARQLQSLLEEFPQASWHQYSPVNRDNLYAGAEMAFGEVVETQYHFENAGVILSLDGDFMFWEPDNVRYIREFANRRRVVAGQTEMNRLYVIESTPSITGAAADHRLPVQAGRIEDYAREVARQLGVQTPGQPAAVAEAHQAWIQALVADLQARRGSSLILAGPQQPATVHALAYAMNQALDNMGSTVVYTGPVQANPVNQNESLRELAQALEAGQVEVLIILGDNPVYKAPADINLGELIPQAGLSIYHSLYHDETAAVTDWHIPATHFLEMWSDTRSFDGTVTIIQPLIEPLYGGRSAHELLAEAGGLTGVTGQDIVRRNWQELSQEMEVGEGEFDRFWRQALHDGLVAGSAAELRQVSLRPDFSAHLAAPVQPPQADVQELEIVFAPDPSIWDGRFANNAWLQELPKPLTKLTWDNAALISPATAQRLGVENEQVVELQYAGRSLQAPVFILPGQAENSITVHLGYGRRRGGTVLAGAGFNAYALRTTEAPWFSYGLQVRPTGERYRLATTQDHNSMEGRDLIRVGTMAEFQEDPHFPHADEHHAEQLPSLYPEFAYEGHAWGMSIDLTSCVGCNACVTACVAENNIPMVGKDQVQNSREMHWLRIDRYFSGELDNPQILFQGVLCMHCEKAPCEPVCPVAATVHSSEGLNEMVYNRCIGTRYCSNNCPYKVRRFNFLEYSEHAVPLRLLHNPEVTVRSRGVMEKCTYCVQRINRARIEAKKEGRRVQDGEVLTACQQACPAQAIVFGDINDENSQVRRLKEQPHDYGMLAELGTQPRTTYLAKIRNPNPEIEDP